MWLIVLSDQLRIVALVGHYPTNKLIRRELVLLTRSPLSPVPKDRFSLDLHVLSAPPAFVLSQDQTLREE